MRTLLRARLPVVTLLAALTFATALAVSPAYLYFPFNRPFGWLSPLLVGVVLGYAAVSMLVGLWACLGALAGRPGGLESAGSLEPGGWSRRSSLLGSTGPWDRGSRVGINPHVVAAGVLALLVVVEGMAHVAERSGSWATSVPAQGMDETTADGHVVWLEGIPLQEDSGTFLTGLDVMSGLQPVAAITAYARSGRLAYPFLVSLLAPATGHLGSVYAAFVGLNLLLWWGGSLAVYDLARRACLSWWAGLAAGTLVATGIGFTYMAGNAMSAAAAYGAVAIVLWLMGRLGVFAVRSPWTDDALTACLAAGAGLLNSLAPFFLCFTAFYYVGRVELRRLLLWAALVLGIGEGLSLLLGWVGRPPTDVSPAGDMRVALLIAAGLVVLVILARLPRRWGEWVVGAGVTIVVIGLAVIALAAPGRMLRAADVTLAGLHLPDYLSGAGRILTPVVSTDWLVHLDSLRGNGMDLNFLAAFPLPMAPFALVGLLGLSRPWRDWCMVVFVSAGLTTFLMNAVTSSPHPRLMYVAYPGIYLCVAQGLLQLHRVLHRLVRRWTWPPATVARIMTTGVVVACLVLVAVPSNASLWGDWQFDRAFHFLEFD